MVSGLEVYCTPYVFAIQHGQDAPVQAAMLTDTMLEKGDAERHALWKRIVTAVEELQMTEPRPLAQHI